MLRSVVTGDNGREEGGGGGAAMDDATDTHY